MMQYLGDLSFELTFKKSNCAKLKVITSLAWNLLNGQLIVTPMTNGLLSLLSYHSI
jgi:hypothetical protein